MKREQKEMLVKSLGALFFSCGSNTPDEVFWGGNALLDWYEKEFNLSLGIRFERDVQTFDINYDDVIEAIRNS